MDIVSCLRLEPKEEYLLILYKEIVFIGHITVYIWRPQYLKNIYGHVSMVLSNGKYMSFWPADGKTIAGAEIGKKDNKKGRSSGGRGCKTTIDLHADIKKEKGEPYYEIPLHKHLDEDAMKAWWDNWSNTGNYELLGYNCAWAIYACLRKGGAPVSATIFWRPETMRRYLNLWISGASPWTIFLNLPTLE